MLRLGIPVLCAGLSCGYLLSQPLADPASANGSAPTADAGPVVLDWLPPAMTQLNAEATTRSSFSLDRTMLAAAAGMISGADEDARQAISKLDGVSVRMLNFAVPGMADPAQVDAVREAYHLRGWKHLVSTTGSGGPVHNGTADVWLVLDGVNVRGAVVLMQSAKSLTLVTLAGNLSPVDILHLRGHFGIPRFDDDRLSGDSGR
jgi:hypothetical protein